MDSKADLHIFTRFTLFSLVAVVIVGFVAALLTGEWLFAGLMLGAYLVVTALQWYAAYRRAQAGGFTGEF